MKAYTGSALTKRDLAVTVAERSGLNQFQAVQAVQATLDGIVASLAQGRHVEFREFGVFEIVTRKARVGRNPNRPQETVAIPAHQCVKFKPGKRMREMFQQGVKELRGSGVKELRGSGIKGLRG